MPTDAPNGLINSSVVQGRRPDHVTPKTPRVRPVHEKAADVTSEDVAPVVEDKPKPVKAAAKGAKG